VIDRVYESFEDGKSAWKESGCVVKVSFLEIYMDGVTDLLHSKDY